MRALAVCLAAALLFASADVASGQISLGVRVGATLSDISVDSDGIEPEFDSRTGFSLGAYLDLPLSGNLFFQPGIGLAQKGAKLTEEEQGEEISLGINLDYVEMPLLFRYAFSTTGALGVHLLAGPALAFESSCTVKLEADGLDIEADCDQAGDEDIEVDTESFDFGAMFGGGVSFPLGGVRGTLEALYNVGLKNVAGGDDSDTSKNRAFYLMAGLRIPIG